jgi:hypothetical protein
VRVIDGEAHRTARGKVGDQPVEAVEHRERGLRTDRDLAGLRGGAWERERPGGHTGGSLEQIDALRRGRFGQRWLEQLADDAECVLALELGAPRIEHAHPAGVGHLARDREQRGLPNSRRALDHDEAPAAVASPGER